LALIIGDAIHNLHTALDLAIYELVRDRLKGVSMAEVSFPFNKSRDEFITSGRSRKIAQASSAIFDFLATSVKPYKGGNDHLYALHRLDILDKHWSLIPTIELSAVLGIDAEDDKGGHVSNLTAIVIGESTWLETSLSGNIKINSHGKAVFFVGFAKHSPIMAGRVVLPTLNEFTKIVESIIDTFETILS
jgi:hypothetical protein